MTWLHLLYHCTDILLCTDDIKYIIQIWYYTTGWLLSKTIKFDSHACTVNPHHILTIDKATLKNVDCLIKCSEPGSVDGIATGYGLDGPGIEFRWRRHFPHLSRPALGPGTLSFLGVKSGVGVTLIPHPLLVPRSWKSRAIPLLPPMGRTAFTEPQCPYNSALYLYTFMECTICSLVLINVINSVSIWTSNAL